MHLDLQFFLVFAGSQDHLKKGLALSNLDAKQQAPVQDLGKISVSL